MRITGNRVNVPMMGGFSSVEESLEALHSGGPVVVIDDADREDEADLVMGAQTVTEESMAFMIRHTSGIVCVPMESSRADALCLPPMTCENSDPRGTAFTVSVDSRTGISTGVSAADRARTIAALGNPMSRAEDFRKPGHVFPLRAREGGVLTRPGHTEAAVDLCRLSGLQPVGAIAELINMDGSMSRLADAFEFAQANRLPILSVAEISKFRLRTDNLMRRMAEVRLPTEFGYFTAYGYRSEIHNAEFLALAGKIDRARPVLTRIQSECMTGEVFASERCDCREQLEFSLELISTRGGVLVYLLGQEGRGIGMIDKLRAYELQDGGLDTVEANLALGLPIDDRKYWMAGQILADLGITDIRLLTNNPEKISQVEDTGIRVMERVPMPSPADGYAAGYVTTKRAKLGHLLPA